MIAHYLRLARPHQWTKNLLVFAALVFTARWSDPTFLLRSVLAFFGMCFLSSSVYVVNDLLDAPRDRRHPKKQHRPIAAGAVTTTQAFIYGQVLALLGIVLLAFVDISTLTLAGVFIAAQATYNLRAKHVAILDVFVLSFGFVLRAAIGAAAIDARISGWLLLCTGALALTLGFGKRRSEYIAQGGESTTRSSLGQYNQKSLDFLVATSALGAAMCYGMYALESPTAKAYPGLFFTTPFVFYGVCRYVLIVFQDESTEEPERLLYNDPHILVSVLLFLVAAVIAINNPIRPFVE